MAQSAVSANRGTTTETLKSGFYCRAPWNDVYVYDIRLQSYTEMVDALSSDDLLVKLKAAIITRSIAEEVYFLAQEIGPDFYPRVVRPELLAAVERKQAKEQEKEQKEFELVLAEKEAEIARRRARGEGDAIGIRSEGEAVGLKIRALGQANAQQTMTKTLTPECLQYKLYDSPDAKMVLLPDQLRVPILINPDQDRGARPAPESLMRTEQDLMGRGH